MHLSPEIWVQHWRSSINQLKFSNFCHLPPPWKKFATVFSRLSHTSLRLFHALQNVLKALQDTFTKLRSVPDLFKILEADTSTVRIILVYLKLFKTSLKRFALLAYHVFKVYRMKQVATASFISFQIGALSIMVTSFSRIVAGAIQISPVRTLSTLLVPISGQLNY